VVYSLPGETLGEALVRAPGRRTMPCVVLRGCYAAWLRRAKWRGVVEAWLWPTTALASVGGRRPVRIELVDSAAVLFDNSRTVCRTRVTRAGQVVRSLGAEAGLVRYRSPFVDAEPQRIEERQSGQLEGRSSV